MDDTPARTAILIPSVPCACAATLNEQALVAEHALSLGLRQYSGEFLHKPGQAVFIALQASDLAALLFELQRNFTEHLLMRVLVFFQCLFLQILLCLQRCNFSAFLFGLGSDRM